MDYCYQCRRHLNGALACAGCGTPAEELRQQAPVPPGPQHSADPGREDGGDGEHEEFGNVPEGEDRRIGGPAPGRTARRRTEQREARGKKRGRVVVIGVIGVVLAAGAVGVAQFALHDQGNGAATVVKEETSLNGDTVQPPSDSPAKPAAPRSAAAPSVSADDSPTSSDSGEVSPTPSPDASASSSPTATAPRSSEAPPSSHSGHGHGHSSGSAHPSSSSGAPTSADPSSGSPTPHPSETHKCTHILWWCS